MVSWLHNVEKITIITFWTNKWFDQRFFRRSQLGQPVELLVLNSLEAETEVSVQREWPSKRSSHDNSAHYQRPAMLSRSLRRPFFFWTGFTCLYAYEINRLTKLRFADKMWDQLFVQSVIIFLFIMLSWWFDLNPIWKGTGQSESHTGVVDGK